MLLTQSKSKSLLPTVIYSGFSNILSTVFFLPSYISTDQGYHDDNLDYFLMGLLQQDVALTLVLHFTLGASCGYTCEIWKLNINVPPLPITFTLKLKTRIL